MDLGERLSSLMLGFRLTSFLQSSTVEKTGASKVKTRIDYPLGGRPQVVFYDDPNQESIRYLDAALQETQSHINYLHDVNYRLNNELAYQESEIERNRSELASLQHKIDKMEYEKSLEKKASQLEKLIEQHGLSNVIANASWSGGSVGLLSEFLHVYLFTKYDVQSEKYDSIIESLIDAYRLQVQGRDLISDYVFFFGLTINSTIFAENKPYTWNYEDTYPYTDIDSDKIKIQVLRQKFDDTRQNKIDSLSSSVSTVQTSIRAYENHGKRNHFGILFSLIALQVFFEIGIFPSQSLLVITAIASIMEFTRWSWDEAIIFLVRISFISFLLWNWFSYYSMSSYQYAFQTFAVFILVIYTFFIDIKYNSNEDKFRIARESLNRTNDGDLLLVQDQIQEASDLLQLRVFLHNKVAGMIEHCDSSIIELDPFFSDNNREKCMLGFHLKVFNFLSTYRTYPSQPKIKLPAELLTSTIPRTHSDLELMAFRLGMLQPLS